MRTFIGMVIILSLLQACSDGPEAEQASKPETVFDSQTEALDKAHQVDQMMQDHQKELDRQLQDTTR